MHTLLAASFIYNYISMDNSTTCYSTKQAYYNTTLPPLASPGPGGPEGEVDELCALLADDGLLVAAGDVVPRHAVLNIGAEKVNRFDIDTFGLSVTHYYGIGFASLEYNN